MFSLGVKRAAFLSGKKVGGEFEQNSGRSLMFALNHKIVTEFTILTYRSIFENLTRISGMLAYIIDVEVRNIESQI